jgi:hypothetical protein
LACTDDENDALKWYADILPAPALFDPLTRDLTFSPDAIGTWYAKIRVSDPRTGGSDQLLFLLSSNNARPATSRASLEEAHGLEFGPNPMRSMFLFSPSSRTTSGWARVYDLAGRAVAFVYAEPRQALAWNGRDFEGLRVRPGIYLYRSGAEGALAKQGKIVVLR